MASDVEGQNSAAVGNSSADYRKQPGFDYWQIFISIATICICSLPNWGLAWKTRDLRYSFVLPTGTIVPYSVLGFIVLQYPYTVMVIICFPELREIRKQVDRSSEGIAGIYYKSQMKPSLYGRIFMTSLKIFARIGLLISWGVAIILFLPSFKWKTVLGSPLWKWSLLTFLVPSVYFASLSVCFIILIFIRGLAAVIRRKKGYPYQYQGLLGNMVPVVYFGNLLYAWNGYFRTERGLKHPSIHHLEPIFDQVTWICVFLLVGSILWVFKTYIIMMWSARAIYRRFKPRILMATVKYFYLFLMVGDFFIPSIISEMKLVEEYVLQSESQDYKFVEYIKSKHAEAAYLDLVGQYLTSLAETVKPLQDQGVEKLLDYFKNKIPATTDTCQTVDLGKLIESWDLSDHNLQRHRQTRGQYIAHFLTDPLLFGNSRTFKQEQAIDYRKNIVNVLHRIVQEQYPTQNHFTFDDLKRWMVDAHLNCLNLGRTLADSAAIVKCLDITISIIISALVVFMWLLISGLATTKILVTIGTPLLALTFIFGDSVKMFFQGFVFCFGTHSFDVGDLCILDNAELEVERMGILTTKFVKIGTKERRMYPNALLATKAIINKGWEPDPSDTVELKLEMSTFRKQWDALESKLKSFFNDNQHSRVFQSSYEETMEEIDDKIKVIIHFKHVLNVEEMTHSQCFRKKKKHRSIILKSITQFLEPDQPIGNHDDSVPVNPPVIPGNDLGQPSNMSGSRLWNGLV